MAVRIKHKVRVQIARDTAMKNGLFMPDDVLSEVVIDGFEKQANSVLQIAENEEEDLSFGDVTVVKGLYLEVDQDCLVTLNDSADSIQLRKSSTLSTVMAKLFIEGDISKVTVTAPVTLPVNGVYCVWGDVTV